MCIQCDLSDISNLLTERLEAEWLPLGTRIMRDLFPTASKYFSERHRNLRESPIIRTIAACPVSLLPPSMPHHGAWLIL